MKAKADISPYWYSNDWGVNKSITMMKIHRRILDITPTHKRMSRFQRRCRSARAAYFGKRTCS